MTVANITRIMTLTYKSTRVFDLNESAFIFYLLYFYFS
jgi:hypothetical protein